MRRVPDKQPDAHYSAEYNYQNDLRLRSPMSHLSNSVRYKDQFTPPQVPYYRKASYNTHLQNDHYSRTAQRVDERKNYEPYTGYASTRSLLEDSSIKHNTFSSTGNLNSSSVQGANRDTKWDLKQSSIRRDSSLYYRSQPSNLEKSYLEDSKVQPTSNSHIFRQEKYYSNNLPPPPQHTYRRQTISILPDRRQSFIRQPQPPEEEPYFEYILRYSYRSKRGFAPSNPAKLNQDAFITVPNINSQTFQHYFGVCDGHGVKGHLVSSFIKSKLPSMLAKIKNFKNPRQQLIDAHKKISDQLLEEQSIDATYSGSTSVGCYLNHNKLYCCNVGDSRAILGKRNRSGQWTVKALSTDHKPCLQREAARIIKAGGRIDPCKDGEGEAIGPLRVWFKDRNIPGLAMTRSFGDTIASSLGVNSIPEVDQYTLTTEDKIVVIASDGLWEFLSSKEVIEILAPFYDESKIQQSCNTLLETAINKWKEQSTCLDDITFVVLFLDYSFPKN